MQTRTPQRTTPQIWGVGDLDVEVARGGSGGGAQVSVGSIVDINPAPPDPTRQREGNLWYNPVNGRMYLFAWGAWFGPIT